MSAPARPWCTRHPRLLAGLTSSALVAFLFLAVAAHRVPFFACDLTLTRALQGVNVPWLDTLWSSVGALGFIPVVDYIDVATLLALFFAGRRWESAAAGFAVVGAAGLHYIVKPLVMRPRPPTDLVHVAHHFPASNSSFPAGHVLNAVAFVGFLCYLAWTRMPPSWLRTTLVATLVAYIALMGPARIGAGDHWPSDVLGGYLLGAVWLVLSVVLYEWRSQRGAQRGGEPQAGVADEH